MDLEDYCLYHENSSEPKNVYIESAKNVVEDLVKVGFKIEEIAYQQTRRQQINLLTDANNCGPVEYYFIAKK